MLQQVLIIAIFLSAVGYLISLVYKSFQSRKACTGGCSQCSAEDIGKLEKLLSEIPSKR